MSISSSEAMALDRGCDLLDAIMHGDRDRRWIRAAIRDQFPLDQEDGKGRNALLWAAAKGYTQEVELMLSRGVWADKADAEGKTPLILAAEGGFMELTKIFAERTKNIDARDKAGRSAADHALTKGYNEITAYLVGAGATPPPVDLDTELKQPAAVFSRPLSLRRK